MSTTTIHGLQIDGTYRLQHAAVSGERLTAELSKRVQRLRSYARQDVTGWVKDRHAGYLYASALELALRLESAYENVDEIPVRHWRTLESFSSATGYAQSRGVLPRLDADTIESAVLAAVPA